TSRIRYFSLDFAERIGQHFYCGIASEGRPSVRELAGEWIFARALQLGGPARDRHGQRYVDEILRQGAPDAARTWDRPPSPALIAGLLRARDGAEDFLAECTAEVVALRPRIVGFTSVFQQHVASLALARRVKQALPQTFVVMGGANCEGPMGAETVRQFPFV